MLLLAVVRSVDAFFPPPPETWIYTWAALGVLVALGVVATLAVGVRDADRVDFVTGKDLDSIAENLGTRRTVETDADLRSRLLELIRGSR